MRFACPANLPARSMVTPFASYTPRVQSVHWLTGAGQYLLESTRVYDTLTRPPLNSLEQSVHQLVRLCRSDLKRRQIWPFFLRRRRGFKDFQALLRHSRLCLGELVELLVEDTSTRDTKEKSTSSLRVTLE